MKDRCEDEIPLKRTARQAAGRPKKAAAPSPPRIPRITRLMALAIEFQDMIDRGEVKDYADLARLGYVTRARVTQIMNLTLLAPDIQEKLLSAKSDSAGALAAERHLRHVSSLAHWSEQRKRFRVEGQVGLSGTNSSISWGRTAIARNSLSGSQQDVRDVSDVPDVPPDIDFALFFS